MTTVTIKGALHLVDWGPLRYKAFHFLMGMDTTHKYHADMLWGVVLMPCSIVFIYCSILFTAILLSFDRDVFDLLIASPSIV